MSQIKKTLERILNGASDANIRFDDLCELLRFFKFRERIKGSHHIFSSNAIPEIINIQPLGNKAKAYQVRQVRGIILKYRMAKDDDNA